MCPKGWMVGWFVVALLAPSGQLMQFGYKFYFVTLLELAEKLLLVKFLVLQSKIKQKQNEMIIKICWA